MAIDQGERFRSNVIEAITNRGGKAHYGEIANSLGLSTADLKPILKKTPGIRHTSHGYWIVAGSPNSKAAVARTTKLQESRRRRILPSRHPSPLAKSGSHPAKLQFVLSRGDRMVYKDGRGGLWIVMPAEVVEATK